MNHKSENSDENSIKELVDNNLCCGCGTCFAVCQRDAISLNVNPRIGVYSAKVDDKKCNGCGLCLKACPGSGVDFPLLNKKLFGANLPDPQMGFYTAAFTAFSTNEKIRYNAASGGVITSLLIYALENGIIDGAMVTSASSNAPIRPQASIAYTAEEIVCASRSKYCPIPANKAIREIMKSPEGKRFAIVGLPCHIQGLRKAESSNKSLQEKIVLHLGLFCEYCPSFLATEFLLRHKSIKPESVTRFEYRGDGWPGKVSIETDNGRKSYPFGDIWSIWQRGFFSMRCQLCVDKANELADVSFADPWLLAHDNIGSTLVLTRSKNSEDTLLKMSSAKQIQIQRVTDIDSLIKGQSNFHKKNLARSNMGLLKLLHKPIPQYESIFEAKPSFLDYLITIRMDFMIMIFRQKYLWPVVSYSIPVVASLLKLIRFFKR